MRWLAMSTPGAQPRNARVVLRLFLALVLMVVGYSFAFDWIMEREDQHHSAATAVYWVLVTMSTLGFGDITFQSDLGRAYSVLVLLSGSMFIFVLLPFTFIHFIFLPRLEARALARAPRQLPEGEAGHVLLTRTGPIEDALIKRLNRASIPYAVIESDLHEALALHDNGYRVIVGALDDPKTYRSARVETARLVAATGPDTTNTNVAFTVREIAPSVQIVGVASADASVNILRFAGCDKILHLGAMLGGAFAERILRPDSDSHVIGKFDAVLIAEAAVAGTPLVGRTLAASRLRETVGVNVVGVWVKGSFHTATAELRLDERSVLVLAGSREQLDAYDESFSIEAPDADAPVIIIGGGRVGCGCAKALAAGGYDYRIVERMPARLSDDEHYIAGDAAELPVLHRAGIETAPAVVLTTHDDDTNVYLSIYCRGLRPDVQVLARANIDRNVSTLHRAGADVVLSYASSGATAIWNCLQPDSTLLLAEGLVVFRSPVPKAMAGRTLRQCDVRGSTGCNVIALRSDGMTDANPDPDRKLTPADELILIGDSRAEQRFFGGDES